MGVMQVRLTPNQAVFLMTTVSYGDGGALFWQSALSQLKARLPEKRRKNVTWDIVSEASVLPLEWDVLFEEVGLDSD